MKILIHFILLFLISCMSYKSNLTNNGILKSNYQLVWSEFFTENNLDTNKWNIEIRDPGWVNNELQAYTDKKDNIENAFSEELLLILEKRNVYMNLNKKKLERACVSNTKSTPGGVLAPENSRKL